MFQNITKNWEDEEYEDVEFDKKAAIKERRRIGIHSRTAIIRY